MEITLAFLLTALAAYTLLGGADFGGGLLEASLRSHPGLRKRLEATLAPIWEANHVWLIAIIVILFVGFPAVYAALCTHFFVPLSLALLGIILRGAFFTFRKYDPEPERRLRWYGWLFRGGSVLAPMMYGFMVAALLQPLPVLPGDGSQDFYQLYVAPWLTPLGLLCALFVNLLFAYLASVFFFGELKVGEGRGVVRRRVLIFFSLTFLVGGLCLAWGAASGVVTWAQAWNPVQVLAQLLALACVPWLLFAMTWQQVWGMRLAAGAQVMAILVGWFSTQYPLFMRFEDGTQLAVSDAGAHATTLFWLNIGLAVVLAMVLPLMVYLYRVFDATREAGIEP